jgi:hypothetical protein
VGGRSLCPARTFFFRPDLTPGQAAPYFSRVLNEWLPAEVARLLTAEAGFAGSNEGDIPALAIATALERTLLREHFSPAILELLFEAAWFSPKYAYPAHLEILRDIVLALLGRNHDSGSARPARGLMPKRAGRERFISPRISSCLAAVGAVANGRRAWGVN